MQQKNGFSPLIYISIITLASVGIVFGSIYLKKYYLNSQKGETPTTPISQQLPVLSTPSATSKTAPTTESADYLEYKLTESEVKEINNWKTLDYKVSKYTIKYPNNFFSYARVCSRW